MANTKISALTSITGANVDTTADVFPIVDTSVTTTKKIVGDELKIALHTAPGPIGGTTPSTGAFTTLSATGLTVSGDAIHSSATPKIITDTTDGSDNKILKLNGGGASGNTRGAQLNLSGNEETGTGSATLVAGDVIGGTIGFATGSGAPLRLIVDRPGNIVVGNLGAGALATNATDGFLHMDSCAGTPTGVPTAYTGRVPFVYDSTNNIIYIYNGGWKKTAALT